MNFDTVSRACNKAKKCNIFIDEINEDSKNGKQISIMQMHEAIKKVFSCWEHEKERIKICFDYPCWDSYVEHIIQERNTDTFIILCFQKYLLQMIIKILNAKCTPNDDSYLTLLNKNKWKDIYIWLFPTLHTDKENIGFDDISQHISVCNEIITLLMLGMNMKCIDNMGKKFNNTLLFNYILECFYGEELNIVSKKLLHNTAMTATKPYDIYEVVIYLEKNDYVFDVDDIIILYDNNYALKNIKKYINEKNKNNFLEQYLQRIKKNKFNPYSKLIENNDVNIEILENICNIGCNLIGIKTLINRTGLVPNQKCLENATLYGGNHGTIHYLVETFGLIPNMECLVNVSKCKNYKSLQYFVEKFNLKINKDCLLSYASANSDAMLGFMIEHM